MSVKVEMSPWHTQWTLAAQLHMISTHYTAAFSEKRSSVSIMPSGVGRREAGKMAQLLQVLVEKPGHFT